MKPLRLWKYNIYCKQAKNAIVLSCSLDGLQLQRFQKENTQQNDNVRIYYINKSSDSL